MKQNILSKSGRDRVRSVAGFIFMAGIWFALMYYVLPKLGFST